MLPSNVVFTSDEAQFKKASSDNYTSNWSKTAFSSPSLSQKTESEIESRKKFRSNANNETKRNGTKPKQKRTKRKKEFRFRFRFETSVESNRLFRKKRFVMMNKNAKELETVRTGFEWAKLVLGFLSLLLSALKSKTTPVECKFGSVGVSNSWPCEEYLL